MPQLDVRRPFAKAWPRLPLPASLRWAIWRRTHSPSMFVLSHLRGMRGIEIGGSAHNDYKLDAINVDRFGDPDGFYKRDEKRMCGRSRPVDVVAPGDQLPFPDDFADFVFASHVIEHFPNPLGALYEWRRVAQRLVVVVVPHRDRTFDADRPLTPTAELLDRDARGLTDDQDRHWSVWTRESFLEMCAAADLRVLDSLDPDDKMGNGFVVVLDATAEAEHQPER